MDKSLFDRLRALSSKMSTPIVVASEEQGDAFVLLPLDHYEVLLGATEQPRQMVQPVVEKPLAQQAAKPAPAYDESSVEIPTLEQLASEAEMLEEPARKPIPQQEQEEVFSEEKFYIEPVE